MCYRTGANLGGGEIWAVTERIHQQKAEVSYLAVQIWHMNNLHISSAGGGPWTASRLGIRADTSCFYAKFKRWMQNGKVMSIRPHISSPKLLNGFSVKFYTCSLHHNLLSEINFVQYRYSVTSTLNVTENQLRFFFLKCNSSHKILHIT
jgi:hypothetical protein